ncbi:uncharacterized protein J7T54_002988 [Emericellopsis cladophorae]|uniref:GH16 domain-containing protein n=1 Tax=Emericellopsis cladophorae TaxID=2686198 RepID=A0A9P9XZK6_9HYPO|nr:uncharacterized protein J7T54_002988 [Emericellopsis cladophorae]KAI6780209.1 hypothetical protein J7T54_002988 [Emericellopsis cladophorae]
MRSALVSLVVLAGSSAAAAGQYVLSEEISPDNFFDKFDFFESDHTTGDYLDVDPAGGFVNYAKGPSDLCSSRDGHVSLGVDTTSVLPGDGHAGRDSARLETKKSYQYGLIIARFAQFPKAQCGVWPAFWTHGPNWPDGGEVDLYEQWNDATKSGPVFHVGDSSKYGQCILDGEDQTAEVVTDNCDNTFSNEPHQYLNQGCITKDAAAPWANPNGGVYAMEWTSDFIKVFTWTHETVPADVASSNPDPSKWGTPAAFLKNNKCDIDKHFGPQKMVLNIDFCGAPAGLESEWGKACKAATGYDTCVEYVAKEPKAFEGVEFKIQDIRHFVVGEADDKKGDDKEESPETPKEEPKKEPKEEPKEDQDPDKIKGPQVPTSIIQPQPPKTTEEPVILTSNIPVPSSTNGEPDKPDSTPSPEISTIASSELPLPSEEGQGISTKHTTTRSTVTVTDCPPEVVDCPGRPAKSTHVPVNEELPEQTSKAVLPTQHPSTFSTRVVVTKLTTICPVDEDGKPVKTETPVESPEMPHETPVTSVKPTPKTTLTPKVPAKPSTETPIKPTVTSFVICPPGAENCPVDSTTATTPAPELETIVAPNPTPEEPIPEEPAVSLCMTCEMPSLSTSLGLPNATPLPIDDCEGDDCPPRPTPVPGAGTNISGGNTGLLLGAAFVGVLVLL